MHTSLVITSVSAPNPVMQDCAEGCSRHDTEFIVIGDTKSPSDFTLAGCDYWSIERQRTLTFGLAELLPEKNYARKNLGYLLAMHRGAEIIIETDDDNSPLETFWAERAAMREARLCTDTGWLNIYNYFSDALIWPRGFPLEHVKDSAPSLEGSRGSHFCPIQQGLVNGNPDVDAIYRMTLPLPQVFKEPDPVVVGRGCWTPFNSQNTTWFKEAFMLLYLPSTCSFRMTDIWRSFVALRICWANGWGVMFHAPTVHQERNHHDLTADFADEISGYLNNKAICRELGQLELAAGAGHLAENMFRCYREILRLGLIQKSEMDLLAAWVDDVENARSAAPLLRH